MEEQLSIQWPKEKAKKNQQWSTYNITQQKKKPMFFPNKTSIICKLGFRKLYPTVNNIQYDYLYFKTVFPLVIPIENSLKERLEYI